MFGRARSVLTGLILVTLVVATRPASADGVGVGAKVGPLFSTFSSDTLNFKTRTGLMGGIWFGGNRSGTVGLQGELMYAVKKIQDAAGNDTDLHYLEIPILLRLNFGSANRERAAGYIIAGPAFDVKLKAELNGVDIGEQYEGLDIGIIGGAGVEITRFLIEGRYNWGLRNVVAGNLANTTKIKGKSFALLFGVRFN